MKFTDEIFCLRVNQDISGLFCSFNGNTGDCKECQWDGEAVLPLPIYFVFNQLHLIRMLNELNITSMDGIRRLKVSGLRSNFSRLTFKKIIKEIERNDITI